MSNVPAPPPAADSAAPAGLRWLSRLFLGVCVALLFTPTLGQVALRVAGRRFPALGAIAGPKLTGVTATATLPHPSLHGWLDGSFQDGVSRWAAQNEGPRQYLVRLYNQANYSLLRHSSMEGVTVLVGKRDTLFERKTVEGVKGLRPPRPHEELETLFERLARLQARLKSRGIAFTVVITPAKPSVYPELLPEAFARAPAEFATDYDLVVAGLQSRGVRFVDGPKLSRAARARENDPLFCRGATHWDHLAAYYTAQGLLRTLAEARGETAPQLVLNEKTLLPSPTFFYDQDLAQLLNVLSPPLHYPEPKIKVGVVPDQPALDGGKAIFVGSSFNWMLLDVLSGSGALQDADLYFYYRRRFRYPRFTGWLTGKTAAEEAVTPGQVDWERDVLAANALVYEFNEADFQSGPGTHHYAFLSDILDYLDRHPAATGPR